MEIIIAQKFQTILQIKPTIIQYNTGKMNENNKMIKNG
jgi:hypothetical protein